MLFLLFVIVDLLFVVVFRYIFCTSLSLSGNLGPLNGYRTAAARAALAIPTSVGNVFMCPNDGTTANVWDF